jgi:hypothetical protein
VESLSCFRRLMLDAEYWCVQRFDVVLTADRTSFPQRRNQDRGNREDRREGKSTFKELFGSSSFPRLRLYLELAKGRNGGSSRTIAMLEQEANGSRRAHSSGSNRKILV